MSTNSSPDLTAKDLRERLGLSKGYASDLVNGNRKPSLDLAIRIERELGVPVTRWADEPTSEAAA